MKYFHIVMWCCEAGLAKLIQQLHFKIKEIKTGLEAQEETYDVVFNIDIIAGGIVKNNLIL